MQDSLNAFISHINGEKKRGSKKKKDKNKYLTSSKIKHTKGYCFPINILRVKRTAFSYQNQELLITQLFIIIK